MIPKPRIEILLIAFTFTLGSLGAFSVCEAVQPSTQIKTQTLPSYCKIGKLNAENLMMDISAIIKHGDLTDFPFAEKTFQTKFREEPAKTYNGQPDPLRIFFQTDQISGSPVYVDVSLSRLKSNPPKYQSIAYITIYDRHSPGMKTTFIEDCIDISVQTFTAHFGGDFVHVIAADNLSPYTTWYRQQNFPGKNKTVLKLVISSDYMRADNPIVAVEIEQVPHDANSGS